MERIYESSEEGFIRCLFLTQGDTGCRCRVQLTSKNPNASHILRLFPQGLAELILRIRFKN